MSVRTEAKATINQAARSRGEGRETLTNVLHAHGTETIWSLTDGRLCDARQIVNEDARKLMFLEATDGEAIISYAGLGATARKTEPSDWMSAVLRGRNYPMEYSLGILADAVKRELPRHLISLPVPGHAIVSSVLLHGEMRPRVYTITLCRSVAGEWSIEYTQQLTKFRTAPNLVLAGSGALFLDQNRAWKRPLESLIAAHDRGKVSAITIADRLATINNSIYEKLKDLNGKDGTVGPRCVVAWRHRKRGIYGGGGAHQFYRGTSRVSGDKLVPTISGGMDLNAILGVIMPDPTGMLEAMLAANDLSLFRPDTEEINAKLSLLPHHPNEQLS